MKNQRRTIRKANRQQGMTLVEAVVGMALIVLCSMILYTGFSASSRMINRGTEIKNAGQRAAAAAEGAVDDGVTRRITAGTVTFSLGGMDVVESGNYTTVTDSDPSSNAQITVFIPAP